MLPESVAAIPSIARYRREAEVLAALNHPNITAIYSLEKPGGITGLVMELVEGPTLADRITQGAISVDGALPIARQLADSIEAAHDRGVIHRDLKPANIRLRGDGTVKVLDFAGEGAGTRGRERRRTLAVSYAHLSCTFTSGSDARDGGLHGI